MHLKIFEKGNYRRTFIRFIWLIPSWERFFELIWVCMWWIPLPASFRLLKRHFCQGHYRRRPDYRRSSCWASESYVKPYLKFWKSGNSTHIDIAYISFAAALGDIDNTSVLLSFYPNRDVYPTSRIRKCRVACHRSYYTCNLFFFSSLLLQDSSVLLKTWWWIFFDVSGMFLGSYEQCLSGYTGPSISHCLLGN